MSPDQDYNMTSGEDIPLMRRRYSSARNPSIPSTIRSEPTMTSTVASPKLPMTSDILMRSASAPQDRTAEQVLTDQLAATMKEKRQNERKATEVRRKRAEERKELVFKQGRIRQLRSLVMEKDGELAQEKKVFIAKIVELAQEKEERNKLSRAYDELSKAHEHSQRQLEEAKRNPGVDRGQLLQRLDEKDREIEKLKTERATNNDGAVRDLMKRLEGELMRSQAAGAAPPKTAGRGVEMGTQTDDDGLAEKMAALKRLLG